MRVNDVLFVRASFCVLMISIPTRFIEKLHRGGIQSQNTGVAKRSNLIMTIMTTKKSLAKNSCREPNLKEWLQKEQIYKHFKY